MEKEIFSKIQKVDRVNIDQEYDFFSEDLEVEYEKPEIEKHSGGCHCAAGCPNDSILD